jgi:hypothetical protein
VTDTNHQRADYRLLAAAGALLVLLSLAAFVREVTPGWRSDQEEVREWVARHLGPEKAATVPMGLQQIYIQGLERVDRCVTCHTTIEWGPDLEAAPHPARSHPDLPIFQHHPIETFGCTLCHGGQGAATEKEAAHGNLAFWEEPLLDQRRAGRHGLTRAQLMETRCNVCHRDETVVEGMPLLNDAKALVQKKRCIRCHTINCVGASKAPDLTREGDKHPTQFHFPAGWRGPQSAFTWHLEHFKEPFGMVPNSMMPAYTWKEGEPEALALLVLSWRALSLPSAWVPRGPRLQAPDEPGKR